MRAEMAQQLCTNPSNLAKVEPTIRFISVNSVEQSLLPDGCKRARSAKGRQVGASDNLTQSRWHGTASQAGLWNRLKLPYFIYPRCVRY